jgi:hypothetical protein
VNAPKPIDCGLTDVTTGIGFSRVTTLEANKAGSLTTDACTVTTLFGGTLAGAVYWPVDPIRPNVALPPAVPLTDQLTAVFDVPVTVAVNCKAGSPGRTFEAAGLSAMLGCGAGDVPVPAQPVAKDRMSKQSAQFKARVDK